ncbi:hypothetical protein DK37_28225 [Halomonas sp. SUBG004]|nr:hypothetical protein DK37_28225 [Halomonas sp. SUBG004]
MAAVVATLTLKRRVTINRAKLSTNEHLLATILDSVDAYIYIKRRRSNIVTSTGKSVSCSNVLPQEILGKRDDAFFSILAARPKMAEKRSTSAVVGQKK